MLGECQRVLDLAVYKDEVSEDDHDAVGVFKLWVDDI